MRILHLLPGTGSFLCGSCVRDNALIRALRKQGHDAVVLPLYLPIVTDEPSTGEDFAVQLGGVNLYLQEKLSFFRKTPRWLDRLLDAPALLRWSAKRMGMTSAAELGEMNVATLLGEDGNLNKEVSRLAEWLREIPPPDVVSLSNGLLIGLAKTICNVVDAPIVCTLQGEDGFLDSLPEPYRKRSWDILQERAADIDAFIPVSHYYAKVMRERLALPDEKVHPVHNGITLDGYGEPVEAPATPTIGYLARLCEVKGLGRLVDAFVELKSRTGFEDLRLRVAGTMTVTDELYVKRLQGTLKEAGVLGDTEFLPNLDRAQKISFLQSITFLSVPAMYGEAFGLYILEALAAGVPVVQPRHAGFPEVLEATGGGILYDGERPEDLADAMADLLGDGEQRDRLAREGRRSVFENFHVDRMAGDVAQVFESVRTARAAKTR